MAKPEDFKATGPNQVWSWDITFLASSIRGAFYRLYMVLELFSRKAVDWEVHENGSAELACVQREAAGLGYTLTARVGPGRAGPPKDAMYRLFVVIPEL